MTMNWTAILDWTAIRDAATGRAEAITWVVRRSSNDRDALATLLLLDESPHPAAALVAVATIPGRDAPPIQAALAPHVAPALAAWRADPQWAERAIGAATTAALLTRVVADLVVAQRAHPAALRDAVAIVVRDGDSEAVAHCFDALGADGWRALEDEQRGALLARADPADLGRVWDALTDAQRAAAVEAASSRPSIAARLIGRIGAAAWTATDPALRKRRIAAAARYSLWVPSTAPAWPGMIDDERETLARAVIEHGNAESAFTLLKDLGAAGRAALTVEQRAALGARAMKHPESWLVLVWRAADGGWSALTDDERADLLAAAEEAPWRVADLLRDVGVAGWTAMSADDQARIAAVALGAPADLFRCPPAFWPALAGAALPPATMIPAHVLASWRAEDADAALGGLPPEHQAVVLALAPWRPEEAAKDSDRVQRLCMAWNALTVDERVALVLAHPSVLSSVAAAARLRGGASAAVDVVGETVARIVTAPGGAAAKRVVVAMLREAGAWRVWMAAFAPTDGDPPDVGKAWRAAARRGVIADLALCARLAAKEREESNLSCALRRAGR